MSTFQLHPRLAADCWQLGRLSLCRVLLMNDAQYPWFILVPERPNLMELHQLEPAERALFLDESMQLSQALVGLFAPDKLNIASLGNLVPQLHVHHIVRYKDDLAWPAPVWGRLPPQPYASPAVDGMRARVLGVLPLQPVVDVDPV